jgi:fucose permease
MRNMTAIVAIMAVFTLAVCFIILGSVSVELMARLQMDESRFGTLISLFSLSCLIAQLFIGFMVDKFGHKPLAVSGFLIGGLAILLLAFSTSYAFVQVATLLLGVGAICCNTVGNTLLPVVLFDGKDPARASNFGCGFVGLGFVLVPLLIGTFMNDLGLSYTVSVSVIGVSVLAFAVVALLPRYPQVTTGFRLIKSLELLRRPEVLIAAAALACYIGLEWTMNNWTKPLMTELYEAADSTSAVRNASLVLMLFGLAMAVGRFATSALKNVSAMGVKIIAAMSLMSIVAIIVLVKAGTPGLAILSVLVIGLAFAPMFPTIVGVTFDKFEQSVYGSVFGIIFSIGLLGSMILPKVVGYLSKGKTVQESLPIAAVIAGVLFVIALAMGITSNTKKVK